MKRYKEMNNWIGWKEIKEVKTLIGYQETRVQEMKQSYI